jgi:predicted DNA-binding protein (MmcQ/YjbR family)
MAKIDDASAEAVVLALQQICTKLPDAEQYVMVHHPAFRVGKKPFVIGGMVQGQVGPSVTINLGKDMQHQLLDDERFSRTPYIGQHGWVTIPLAKLKKNELKTLVLESYRRIANKKQLAALASVKL